MDVLDLTVDLIEYIHQTLPPSVLLVVSGQVQGDFLQVIEKLSSLGVIKCVAFNNDGTLLAAGFFIGTCVIWDCQTRKTTSVLWDENHTAPTTSICWSKNNRLLLVSDIEKSLILWDAINGNIVARSTLKNIPMQVHLHPGSATPTVCLVCPLSSPPLIVDLKTGSTTVLPITLPDSKKKSDGFIPAIPTAACFNKNGDLVYIGNYNGDILVIDHESINVRAIIPGSARNMIKKIEFSRSGKYLHTNSTDGIIRIYKNLLPIKDALLALNDATRGLGAKKYEAKNLKGIGPKCLDLCQEISVTNVFWKATCVSHDGMWVAGVSSCRDYKIYIWDKRGRSVKIIDGPKEMLIDIKWHPIYHLIVAVSRSGSVYAWRNDAALESKKRDNEFDSVSKIEIGSQYYASQSRSPQKTAGKNDYLKNVAPGSLEEVGVRTYLRRKRKMSKPEEDSVMKPPPSK